MSKKIQDMTHDLISLLGYEAQVDVSVQGDGYLVQIDCEDTGILIGYHGQTLSSLQTIMSHMLYKRLGQWLKLTINISDYWQKREEQLSTLARRALEEVRQTNTSYTMPYLNSRERRYIHMILSEEEGITTESVGEGRERRLVIFPS